VVLSVVHSLRPTLTYVMVEGALSVLGERWPERKSGEKAAKMG
jgi:hypothetical protein